MKGATPGLPGRPCFRRYFNPRTREGCDEADIGLDLIGCQISIHAPVKGATRSFRQGKTSRNFNPRTREGCDYYKLAQKYFPKDFNPRTREGCDYRFSWYHLLFRDFNPRTREGCDVDWTPASHKRLAISIHAPVKGATLLQLFWLRLWRDFNPRTREGCDRLAPVPSLRLSLDFNPRTREGCDKALRLVVKAAAVFQSTHP